jgi:hypothetical protein
MNQFLTIYITDNITLKQTILCLILTLTLGIIYALFYAFTKRKQGFDRSFVTTLVLLPIIVSIVIMLVSNDIVKAFSLGGVFVLIRFRTRIKDTKDAMFLFTTVAVGFAAGLEYFYFAILIAVFILIVLLVLYIVKLDHPDPRTLKIKITIPENLNYVDLFNPIFERYLQEHQLKRVKLTDFGSLIELTYLIKMKDLSVQKKMLDEIRTKNGNLPIIITNDYELVTASK